MKFGFKKQGAAGSPNYNIEKSGEKKRPKREEDSGRLLQIVIRFSIFNCTIIIWDKIFKLLIE